MKQSRSESAINEPVILSNIAVSFSSFSKYRPAPEYELKPGEVVVFVLVALLALMVQLSESARELATVKGSFETAHGAFEEPAINIAL